MLEIKTFTFSSFGTNCYVVSLPQAILLVDPACSNEYEQQQLLRYINSLPSKEVSGLGFYILATHGHLDHLWGAAWATKQWNTPVFMHAADIPYAQAMQRQYDLFGIPAIPQPFLVEDMDSIRHQPDLAGLEIIETPGHTPGSVCFYWPSQKVLLSGDTLFCRGYGRTDLPGGDIHQLIASLRRLNSLPSDTLVYSGHGETTTIGDEKW
jgi:glyoxylase-like metal-dependent hydrolase (beta-lactamase superfamily II)